MKKVIQAWNGISLVIRIIIGMVIGVVLALLFPQAKAIAILGTLFVGALKAIAPLLVFFLVSSAISQHKSGQETNMKSIVVLYLLGTFLAALTAVIASFIFPVTITLTESTAINDIAPPSGIAEVLRNLLINIVANPVKSIVEANYIGILFWAVLVGLALKAAAENTKTVFLNLSEVFSTIVKWIISFAPFGIMGLVFDSVATTGLAGFKKYLVIILLLVGTMLFVALIVNPLITFIYIRKNPYPLVFRCLKDSGITAFFMRSSAANIPVNMTLCEKLGLNKDAYSVSIPLGATINMAGAAVTISVLTLATCNTLDISVDLPTALILSVLSAISACGASGVAGGSLLLIPLSCSLFGIPSDISMMVVGVGFIIGVIQDSCETALNSSTDVLFTAIAEFAERRKRGEEVKF